MVNLQSVYHGSADLQSCTRHFYMKLQGKRTDQGLIAGIGMCKYYQLYIFDAKRCVHVVYYLRKYVDTQGGIPCC